MNTGPQPPMLPKITVGTVKFYPYPQKPKKE
jgi:hypothetical protein